MVKNVFATMDYLWMLILNVNFVITLVSDVMEQLKITVLGVIGKLPTDNWPKELVHQWMDTMKTQNKLLDNVILHAKLALDQRLTNVKPAEKLMIRDNLLIQNVCVMMDFMKIKNWPVRNVTNIVKHALDQKKITVLFVFKEEFQEKEDSVSHHQGIIVMTRNQEKDSLVNVMILAQPVLDKENPTVLLVTMKTHSDVLLKELVNVQMKVSIWDGQNQFVKDVIILAKLVSKIIKNMKNTVLLVGIIDNWLLKENVFQLKDFMMMEAPKIQNHVI